MVWVYLFATSTNFIQNTIDVHYKLMIKFTCAQCIHNIEKMSGPKRSIKITDNFKCTSTNVIYCITCTYFLVKQEDS